MLKGTLDDFALPDIFRLVMVAKRTGKLDIVRSAGSGKVFFREGEVYYAESTVAREPLGQKLIRSGALTEGGLLKALDEHAATGERVGEILVRNGAVTVEQLQAAVREQIEDSVFDLLRWDLGEFTWEGSVIADVEVPISISVENLIMESSRRLDEMELILRKIPSENAVPAMASAPPEGAVEINITPAEWRMLVLVDGRRTIHEIAQLVGMDDFSVMRSVYGLLSAGLVEITDPGVAPDVSAEVREEVDPAQQASSGTDDAVSDVAALENSALEDSASEDSALEDSASEDIPSEDLAPEEEAAEEAAQVVAAEVVTYDDALSEDVVSEVGEEEADLEKLFAAAAVSEEESESDPLSSAPTGAELDEIDIALSEAPFAEASEPPPPPASGGDEGDFASLDLEAAIAAAQVDDDDAQPSIYQDSFVAEITGAFDSDDVVAFGSVDEGRTVFESFTDAPISSNGSSSSDESAAEEDNVIFMGSESADLEPETVEPDRRFEVLSGSGLSEEEESESDDDPLAEGWEPSVVGYDAPEADELTTVVPSDDPFLEDLFGATPDEERQAPPAPAPAAPAPVQETPPVPAGSADESPSVDRASVVRELAGLFSDDDRPRSRTVAPGKAAGDEEEDGRKRVEDDDQVTKGLISRLIDGVKGL